MAFALTDQPTSGPFHRTTLWHRTAPRELFKAWFSGDDERRWSVWKKHLARKGRPEPPPFLAGKRPPILWAWPESWRRDEIAHATSALARCNAVLAGCRSGDVDHTRALEVVAAAYALPDLAAELPAGAWWNLAESLHRLASDAQQLRVGLTNDAEDIVRQQLLAGELPLALGCLFPELEPMRSLREPARQALSAALVALTDGEGLPHARLLAVIGTLSACWTRARSLGDRLKRGAWSRDAESQYQWLIRRLVRLVGADGRLLLGGDGNGSDADTELPDVRKLLASALELVGDMGDCAAAAAAVSKSVVPKAVEFDRHDLPDASLNSTWSSMAVLAGDWSKSGPRLAVAYANDPPRMELQVGGRRLVAGDWTMETVCDGRPVGPVGAWEELCWQSDKNCDFLELGVELADGLRLERQIVLAKRDRVLLLADVVLTADRAPRELRHSFSLPLARGVAWRPEDETRDGVLAAGKQRTAVLPLGLFEWRCDPRGGSLDCESGRIMLTQQITGRALYTGLLLDLDPARSKKPRTWRQLTIAESRERLLHDVAVGFRAQSGDDQWLVYRSLGPAGNRSVLGQNISSEFFAGRFLESGKIKEWIEIEAEQAPVMSIADNLRRVRERIARAAEKAGRTADEVTLVAVTKYVAHSEVAELLAAGCSDFGESRPQELWSKAAEIGPGPGLRWHLVGHLQRNKVRRTLPFVSMIHSVDSERLLAEIDAESALQSPVPVLLEVNTSGEAAKHGLEPENVEPLLSAATRFPRVAICGLMTIAALEGGPDTAARNFATLRELRDRLQLKELSMGMSGDFEVAIREGATMVRIGSALWV